MIVTLSTVSFRLVTVSNTVADSTFAERLAFARVLMHFRTGEAPTNADIGRAVDRTGQWVTKWAESDTPPRDYEVHAPLAKYLAVPETWLIRDDGLPPREDLWADWLAERRAFGDGSESPIPTLERESFEEEQPPARATGTAGRPGAKKRR